MENPKAAISAIKKYFFISLLFYKIKVNNSTLYQIN